MRVFSIIAALTALAACEAPHPFAGTYDVVDSFVLEEDGPAPALPMLEERARLVVKRDHPLGADVLQWEDCPKINADDPRVDAPRRCLRYIDEELAFPALDADGNPSHEVGSATWSEDRVCYPQRRRYTLEPDGSDGLRFTSRWWGGPAVPDRAEQACFGTDHPLDDPAWELWEHHEVLLRRR